MIPIAYIYSPDKLNYSSHKSDFGLLKETFLLKGIETKEVTTIPKSERAFVVIPGYDSIGHEDKLNRQIQKVERVVLFVTSDESGLFDSTKIKHNNIEIWVQSPFDRHASFNRLPIGAPLGIKDLSPEYSDKEYDVFFSGQVTHQRRIELAGVMKSMKNSLYNPTAGFMQGYSPKEYYKYMAKSKIVPAPAGNVTIDSFRFYEAIEMLALPIADCRSSSGELFNFFDFVFYGKLPVTVTSDWNNLPEIATKLLEDYPANLHKVVSWWIMYKRNFANKIMNQVNK